MDIIKLPMDKKEVELIDIKYKDIVILLRTTSNVAKIYEKELSKLDFPVFTDANSNYFETEEIQVIMSISVHSLEN